MALKPTDDLPVRQAVLFGVNREAITKTVFRGFTEPAVSPLQPTMEGYDETLKSMYPYDPSRSRQLLDGAGWRVGGDGIRARGNERLTLRWDTDIQGGFAEMAEFVQAQLRGIGIDVQLRKVAESAWVDAYWKGTLNCGEIIWWFPAPTLLRTMFGSDSVWNASRLKNPKLEGLLDSADMEPDADQRRQFYREAQQLIMREAAMLPLAVNPTVHVLNKAVKGYAVTYLGFPLFHDVSMA
jgi:peptide/nickel transport system substrate-binding protein